MICLPPYLVKRYHIGQGNKTGNKRALATFSHMEFAYNLLNGLFKKYI